jgi:hypothetical protein
MNEPSTNSLAEQRKASLADTQFEVLTKSTTPAGLPRGMSWNPHDGNGARARRLRQMAAQEQREIKRALRANGIDPQSFDLGDDGPERAKPRA